MENKENKSKEGNNLPPPYQEKSDSQTVTSYHSQEKSQPTRYDLERTGYNQQLMGDGQQAAGGQYGEKSEEFNPPVVVVASGQPLLVTLDERIHKSYCGQIALSCFVFWCCCWVLGLIAFILAMIANNSRTSGRHEEAAPLAKASLYTSIAGIIIGIIIIAIVIIVHVTNTH